MASSRKDVGVLRNLVVTLGLLAIPAATDVRAATDENPISITVGEAKAQVGQPTVIQASLTIKDGYQFIEPLPRGNRVIELSAADEAVKFGRRVFRGQTEDKTVTFKLDVTPTKAGAHPINGVFRVGYVVHTDTEHKLMQVSLPLISTVTGVE